MHETKRKIRKMVEGVTTSSGVGGWEKNKKQNGRERKKNKNISGNKQQMANCKTYFLHLMIEKTTRNSSTLSFSLFLFLSFSLSLSLSLPHACQFHAIICSIQQSHSPGITPLGALTVRCNLNCCCCCWRANIPFEEDEPVGLSVIPLLP